MFRAEVSKVVEIGLPILGRQAAEKEEFKEAQTTVVRKEIYMTKFELVSSILNNTNADDLRENCIYWLRGDEFATVNFLQGSRFASKLRKMKERYPDDVEIFDLSAFKVFDYQEKEYKNIVNQNLVKKLAKINKIEFKKQLSELNSIIYSQKDNSFKKA